MFEPLLPPSWPDIRMSSELHQMILRRFSQGFLIFAAVVVTLTLSHGAGYAQAPDGPEVADAPLVEGNGLPYDEAEAHAIDRQLMCPVCPAQTIDQAHVALAQQMRGTVREMLAQGATRQEILDFFADRYGPDVLAAPPKSGFNLVAWVFPPIGVGAALVAGFFVLRYMSVRRAASPAGDGVEHGAPEDLIPYLEMVDRQLDLKTEPKPDPGSTSPADHPFSRNGAAGGASIPGPGDVENRREGDGNAG
jgi:cytochrome c-type biogenesis protein CcmH